MRKLWLSLSILSLSIAASAQNVFIHHDETQNLLRIDPRGELPQYINDPLPFIKRAARPCVIDDDGPAWYYYADEAGRWIPDHLELRVRDSITNTLTTVLINGTNSSGYEKISCTFDSLGRLTSELTYHLSGSTWVLSEKHVLEYQGWILRSDTEYHYADNVRTTTHSLENEIEQDAKGNPVTIISRSIDQGEAATVNRYDVEYAVGIPVAITFSTYDNQMKLLTPVCRYDTFVWGKKPWDIISYSSHELVRNEWQLMRRDIRSTTNDAKWEYKGILRNTNGTWKNIENRLTFDTQKNLSQFSQLESNEGATTSDTTGTIRLMITYAGTTSLPQEIVTAYFDHGAYRPSVKVVYGNDGERNLPAMTLGVYPNPAARQATLYWPSYLSGSGLVEIFNEGGQRVSSTKIDDLAGGLFSMDIASLRNGSYTILLHNTSGTWSRKLLVVN
jgi:hypothetical protein